MNQVAFILENTTVYWYSVVIALAAVAGVCFFMGVCRFHGIDGQKAALSALSAVVLSLLLGRLVYWYCRGDSFSGLLPALTTPASGSFALAGAFAGCILSALAFGGKERGKMLDAMAVAGSGAIALGRLAHFFGTTDRGAVLTEMTALPWAYPIANAVTGEPEYRLATFLLQAMVAFGLFITLSVLLVTRRAKGRSLSALFLMVYGASQVILDSTRYDSLYLRSNGFVSMVQILAAVALAGGLWYVSRGAKKNLGLQKWMVVAWVTLAGLFGGAGYMEYYVQRHGRLALFAYMVMEHCLVAIVVLGIRFWRNSGKEAAA